MIRLFKCLKWGLILAVLFSLVACKSYTDGMLDPKGYIAYEERRLFFDTLALMLIVVLPVIIMSITFAYHYRASHRVDEYQPNWSHSHFLEALWWGIPCVIIIILGVITYKKTHELDPFNQVLGRNEKPLLVQVIALPWKWVFIYPEQNIATVNYLEIPVGQQIEFDITSDNVPMSAFFIPQLGSQIYTMTGMRTRLFLLAEAPGNYLGMNTLFNGDGFPEMQFMTHAVTQEELQHWFAQMKHSPNQLTETAYEKLTAPSVSNQPQFFSSAANHLFYNVINTYISSSGTLHPRNDQGKWIKGS